MTMVNNNSAATASSSALWGESTPPEIVTLYEITTPVRKYIAIESHLRRTLSLNPQFYWTHPAPSYVGTTTIYMLILYKEEDRAVLEKELSPALIVSKRVYLPRFDETEWRIVNKVLTASH